MNVRLMNQIDESHGESGTGYNEIPVCPYAKIVPFIPSRQFITISFA